MVRMSDILKKALGKKNIKEKTVSEPADFAVKEEVPKTQPVLPVEPVVKENLSQPQPIIAPPEPVTQEPAPVIKEEKKEIENNASDIRISPLIAKRLSNEDAVKLYEEASSLIKGIFKEEFEPKSIDNTTIISLVERIISQLQLGNEYLLNLAFINDSTNSDYLYCHSLNVCIYSIEIGLGLGYEKAKLVELGVCALLHDIGMIKYRSLAHQPRKLTLQEYNEIKNHPLIGSQLLANISGMSKAVVVAVFQHHERMDGSGYSSGLIGDSISEYAKILSVVNVYESMTHLRIYHSRNSSLETVQEFLNNKNKFEYKIVKVLIERIGIFPVGCFIRLNNKEVAQVIKLNSGVPLRPVIRIVLDPNGKQVQENKIVDLTTQPTVYIKSEEKINWDWVKF